MNVGSSNPSLSLMPQPPSVTESGLCAETRLTTQSLMPIGAAPIRVKDGLLIQLQSEWWSARSRILMCA